MTNAPSRRNDRLPTPYRDTLLVLLVLTAVLLPTTLLVDIHYDLSERSYRAAEPRPSNDFETPKIHTITGIRTTATPGTPLDSLVITMQPAPGSDPLRIDRIVVQLVKHDDRLWLGYAERGVGPGTFHATVGPHDENPPEPPVLRRDQFARLHVDLESNAFIIEPRDNIRVILLSESGGSSSVRMEAPATFRSDTAIRLY